MYFCTFYNIFQTKRAATGLSASAEETCGLAFACDL